MTIPVMGVKHARLLMCFRFVQQRCLDSSWIDLHTDNALIAHKDYQRRHLHRQRAARAALLLLLLLLGFPSSRRLSVPLRSNDSRHMGNGK
jgi:hypothetical protein